VVAVAQATQTPQELRVLVVQVVVGDQVLGVLTGKPELPILVAAAVVGRAQVAIDLVAMAALASSSFVTPTLLVPLRQQQALQPLQFLAGSVFISGPAPVQSHSEVTHGSLCTTQRIQRGHASDRGA
jgi:hypothetical protein